MLFRSDSASGDAKEAVLAFSCITRDGAVVDPGLMVGAQLAESFSDGPAYWDTDRIKLLKTQIPVRSALPQGYPSVGTTVSTANEANFASRVSSSLGNKLILQDYRDFFAHHGNAANVLMSDGSVKEMIDLNGDGFFNPGFPVDPTLPNLADSVGHTDGVVELNSFEIFTGPMLDFKAVLGKEGSFEE